MVILKSAVQAERVDAAIREEAVVDASGAAAQGVAIDPVSGRKIKLQFSCIFFASNFKRLKIGTVHIILIYAFGFL